MQQPPQGHYPGAPGQGAPGGYPPAQGAPGGAPQQPPKKKSGNGCFIAMAIIGGLALLVVGGVSYGAYTVWRDNPELRKAAKAVGEAGSVMMEAQSAPGTAELRDEANCKVAMVFDVERLLKIGNMFTDAGVKEPPKDMPKLMVMCQVGALSDPPSCKKVARVYVDAVGKAKGNFGVAVQREHANKQICSRQFDRRGKDKGSFDSSRAPIPKQQ